MFPAIRGVQDHMSNWMSSLIQAQDGCLQMVAQRATMGRVQQEHFVQEEEVLAHMRLLSSEAKDWKSRVVTEAEEVLSRKCPSCTSSYRSKAQEAMDQHYKARWRQAEADLKALCQSNSAQAQSLASKLQGDKSGTPAAPNCSRETATAQGTSPTTSSKRGTTSSSNSP